MTDPQPDPRSATGDAPPSLPRWVTIAAIVVGVLILLVVILQLTGFAGDHGPGMHSSLGEVPTAGEPRPAQR